MGSESADLAMAAKFVVAQILAQNLARLVENEMAARLYIKREIIPSLEKDLIELRGFAQSVEIEQGREYLEDWTREYKREVYKLIECVYGISQWHSNRTNNDLNQIISINAYKDQPLAVNALGLCLSAVSDNTTVLSGMRHEDHLKIALETLKLETLDAERVEYLFNSPLLI